VTQDNDKIVGFATREIGNYIGYLYIHHVCQ